LIWAPARTRRRRAGDRCFARGEAHARRLDTPVHTDLLGPDFARLIGGKLLTQAVAGDFVDYAIV